MHKLEYKLRNILDLNVKALKMLELCERRNEVTELAEYVSAHLSQLTGVRELREGRRAALAEDGEQQQQVAQRAAAEDGQSQFECVLQTELFNNSLQLAEHDAALTALLRVPDHNKQMNCLRLLVAQLCERRLFAVLCRLPFKPRMREQVVSCPSFYVLITDSMFLFLIFILFLNSFYLINLHVIKAILFRICSITSPCTSKILDVYLIRQYESQLKF